MHNMCVCGGGGGGGGRGEPLIQPGAWDHIPVRYSNFTKLES